MSPFKTENRIKLHFCGWNHFCNFIFGNPNLPRNVKERPTWFFFSVSATGDYRGWDNPIKSLSILFRRNLFNPWSIFHRCGILLLIKPQKNWNMKVRWRRESMRGWFYCSFWKKKLEIIGYWKLKSQDNFV